MFRTPKCPPPWSRQPNHCKGLFWYLHDWRNRLQYFLPGQVMPGRIRFSLVSIYIYGYPIRTGIVHSHMFRVVMILVLLHDIIRSSRWWNELTEKPCTTTRHHVFYKTTVNSSDSTALTLKRFWLQQHLVLCWGPPTEGGGGGGPCSLVLWKYFFNCGIPCSLKYAFVPVFRFIFLLFNCSLNVNGHVPLFPKTPGWPLLLLTGLTCKSSTVMMRLTLSASK